MNRIEKMLQELCPEGVEYKKLGEVSNITIGEFVHKNKQNLNGKYPVYNGGTSNTGFYDEFNNTKNKIIISARGANAGFVNRVFVNYWAGNSCYSIKINDPKELDWNYIYYYLKSNQTRLIGEQQTGSIPAVSKKQIYNIEIPVPPLPIQEEIIRILDHFTELTASLQAELQAELQARQEQYEYYRNKLLTFTKIGDTQSVTWMKISEIGEICMCKRIMKHQTNSNSGIPFYKIGTFGKKADAYISNELYEEYKKNYSFPRKGEILISASGTIGRTIIYDGKPAYFQDSNIIWISNDERKVLNKFLYYCYQIAEWKTEGGTIKRLYNANLAKMKIAVPPISEQQRIVCILDKFEALVNDLSQGLPAEIAAVQEQYEYYRNQLLTFKRMGE